MPVKHTFRYAPSGSREVTTRTERVGPARAIRFFCMECYGFCENVAQEIAACPSTTCPLFPFRLGADPGRKVSEAQREAGRAAARRLRRAQE